MPKVRHMDSLIQTMGDVAAPRPVEIHFPTIEVTVNDEKKKYQDVTDFWNNCEEIKVMGATIIYE